METYIPEQHKQWLIYEHFYTKKLSLLCDRVVMDGDV